MKRFVPVIFCFFAALSLSAITVFASSSGTCGSGVNWSLNDAGLLEITGNGKITSGAWDTQQVKKLVIQAGVTGIEEYAFSNCSNMSEASLPATVDGIGISVFYNCSSLLRINVDSGNPDLCSVDGVVFNKAKWKLEVCPPGKSGTYTVPSGTTVIENYAFISCRKLTGINFPGNLTGIGECAFLESGLTAVSIPSGVAEISMEAFKGCASLASVVIPEGVTTLKCRIFKGCSKLKTVTLPQSISFISDDAFEGSSITSLNVITGSYAATWAQSKGYTCTYYGGSGEQQNSDENVIAVGETKTYEGSVRIPGSLITTAFIPSSSNSSIATVTAGRGGNAIYADSVLYFFDVSIRGVSPGTVTVTLYTDSTKTVPIWTKTVTVVGSASASPSSSSGQSGSTSSGQSGSSSSGQKGQGASGSSANAVTVGSCKYTLSGSTAVLSGVKSKTVTKLVIPATIKTGGKTYKVTSIGSKACKSLKKLTSLTIGKNISQIGKQAFYGCTKLKKITIKTTKLTKKKVGANAFKNIYAKAAVKCPKSKKSAYKKILQAKGMKKTVSFK